MKFLRNLIFSLPDNPFGSNLDQIQRLNSELKLLTRKAGPENYKIKRELSRLCTSVIQKHDLANEINSPIQVRALAFALNTDVRDKIYLTERLFRK